jgi:hypothetical protein
MIGKFLSGKIDYIPYFNPFPEVCQGKTEIFSTFICEITGFIYKMHKIFGEINLLRVICKRLLTISSLAVHSYGV